MNLVLIITDDDILCYPGFPMTAVSFAPPRRGLRTAGVEDSSVATFCFFARLAGGACVVTVVLAGLRSGSTGALRLRDLGWDWGRAAVGVEAEALEGVAAANEGFAASFDAERVTLGDMRN